MPDRECQSIFLTERMPGRFFRSALFKWIFCFFRRHNLFPISVSQHLKKGAWWPSSPWKDTFSQKGWAQMVAWNKKVWVWVKNNKSAAMDGLTWQLKKYKNLALYSTILSLTHSRMSACWESLHVKLIFDYPGPCKVFFKHQYNVGPPSYKLVYKPQ